MLEIELVAHVAGGAHSPPHDLGVGSLGERVGDDIAAVGKRGQRGVERLVRPMVDIVLPDKMQRRIENMHVDIAVAGEQIDERHGDVAVRQGGDRGPELVPVRELAEIDLPAHLVAGGIVTLADDGLAMRVVGVAQVGPHYDVAAILQRSDLAFELVFAAIRGVDLRGGIPEPRGRGHLSSVACVIRVPVSRKGGHIAAGEPICLQGTCRLP